MSERTWTCTRYFAGVKCGHVNARKYQKCRACGKQRPPHIGRKAAHHKALERSYEEFIEINGGEFCGVCGYIPEEGGRRLDRDHEHSRKSPGYGEPRGLLCPNCNRNVWTGVDSKWALKLFLYLGRFENRIKRQSE